MPVLAIAAHIPLAEVGSDYFQETHPQNLFREIRTILAGRSDELLDLVSTNVARRILKS